MTNNVVLMFSPTDEKTPYEQREPDRTYGHTAQSVAAQSIIHKFLKRLCMDQARKSSNIYLF